MRVVKPKLRLALFSILVLLIGVIGTRNAIVEFGDAATVFQQLATTAELFYGLLGLAGFVALLKRWSQSNVLLALWAIAVSATAGMASMAWGGAEIGAGLAAAAGAAIVVGLISWGALAARRATLAEGKALVGTSTEKR